MVEKINIFVFIFSILFLLKEGYLFVQQILKNREIMDGKVYNENGVIPYQIPFLRLLFVGLAISYFITCLIKGF